MRTLTAGILTLLATISMAEKADVAFHPFRLADSLTVSFPAKPAKEPMDVANLKGNKFTAVFGATAYRCAYVVIPDGERKRLEQEVESDPLGKPVEAVFEGANGGMVKTLGAKVIKKEMGGHKGLPAMRTYFESSTLAGYSLQVLTKDRMIIMIVLSPNGAQDAGRAQSFFDSISFN